jgi:aspartate-semialdehyde dehydrogenase
MRKPKIAIVGATGAVGKELLTLMNERSFQFESLRLVASARSAGSKMNYRDVEYEIQNLETFDFSGVDIAFFSAGTSTSKIWVKKATDAGALVIDNTNAYRMDPKSPLVVPQVNSHALQNRPESGVIANPNCSTIQMVRVLDPIHKRYGIRQVVVSTYQAASGAGLTGMEELASTTQAALAGKSDSVTGRFPRMLAFNVVPQVDVFLDNGFTLEEQKMVQESRKILDSPELRLTATAVRVPVMNGHSEAVYIETDKPMSLPDVLAAIRGGDEVSLYEGADYPTPLLINSKNRVHVGRVRINPENPCGMWCWIVADNLRIGAALNAIQIAEAVSRQEWSTS